MGKSEYKALTVCCWLLQSESHIQDSKHGTDTEDSHYALRVICIEKLEKVAEKHICKAVIILGNDS